MKKLNKELKESMKRLSHDIFLWEDNGVHYVYSTAFELTGYGKSAEKAMEHFNVCVIDFVEYQGDRKTLYNVLEGLGWTVSEKVVIPPSIEEALKYDKDFSDLHKKHRLFTEKYNMKETLTAYEKDWAKAKTKKQKRILIAKDVIAQIEEETIDVQTEVYLKNDNLKRFVGNSLKESLPKMKYPCMVCAIGACLYLL